MSAGWKFKMSVKDPWCSTRWSTLPPAKRTQALSSHYRRTTSSSPALLDGAQHHNDNICNIQMHGLVEFTVNSETSVPYPHWQERNCFFNFFIQTHGSDYFCVLWKWIGNFPRFSPRFCCNMPKTKRWIRGCCLLSLESGKFALDWRGRGMTEELSVVLN